MKKLLVLLPLLLLFGCWTEPIVEKQEYVCEPTQECDREHIRKKINHFVGKYTQMEESFIRDSERLSIQWYECWWINRYSGKTYIMICEKCEWTVCE